MEYLSKPDLTDCASSYGLIKINWRDSYSISAKFIPFTKFVIISALSFLDIIDLFKVHVAVSDAK